MFSLVVLLVLIDSNVGFTKKSYEEMLESYNIEETLRLLGPGSLLENHKTLALRQEDAAGQNWTCARDIAVLWAALLDRDIWALKSK